MSRVTVAIPSYNQGQFLEEAIRSVISQEVSCQLCLADGGSTDQTQEIIHAYRDDFYYSRSFSDNGQSGAINEAIASGDAEYVCWLNSDDRYLTNGLSKLVSFLDENPNVPAVYGDVWFIDEQGRRKSKHFTQKFSEKAMMQRCFISQPSTLIRREIWESLGGVDETLHMVMDYDLWWRIYKEFGALQFVDVDVAEARLHADTKTSTLRRQHYAEAMQMFRNHIGYVPKIWYLKLPWSVWYKSFVKRIVG